MDSGTNLSFVGRRHSKPGAAISDEIPLPVLHHFAGFVRISAPIRLGHRIQSAEKTLKKLYTAWFLG